MRAGKLDRPVTIQRKAVSNDAAGQETATWSALAHRRMAARKVLAGDERFDVGQLSAQQQVEFTIRYSASLADLNPLDRVLYPAPADEDEQSPATDSVHEVVAVEEIGRKRGLKIRTVRRREQ